VRQLRRVIVHGLAVNQLSEILGKNAMAIRTTPQLAQKLDSDLGQIDHPFVRWDLKGFPKPLFGFGKSRCVHKVRVYEVYTHEVHACKMHVYKVHTYEMHACEVHAREMRVHEVCP
jgi:hypothetical protein